MMERWAWAEAEEKMEIIIDTQICISKSRATPYTSLYIFQLMHNTNKGRKEKKIKNVSSKM